MFTEKKREKKKKRAVGCWGVNSLCYFWQNSSGYSCTYMLNVKIIFSLFYFKTTVDYFFFQTRSICLNLDQLVSTKVNMFQPGSTCFNLDHCGAGKKNRSQLATSHKSLFYKYRNNPNCLQMLILSLKNFI